MVKKIGYFLLTLLLLLVIAGIIGIRYFNNLWFKERPNYLTLSCESKPINFNWGAITVGDDIEYHTAILIPMSIPGIPHKLALQFDSGTPSTVLYGNSLKSLRALGLDFEEILQEDQHYLKKLDYRLGESQVSASMIHILKDYGQQFDSSDTTRTIKIGTLGADAMDERITVIDFKNEFLQFYEERPAWMATLPEFEPFDFTGRRFMLPATIDGKELELFYDSGSSAFGLITSKKRFNNYTDKDQKEIEYVANRWGEGLNVHHKSTNTMMEMGGTKLSLKRISYVDMYADFQHFITPFTRIGGWLGNKPFTESTLILDTKQEEFIIIEGVNK